MRLQQHKWSACIDKFSRGNSEIALVTVINDGRLVTKRKMQPLHTIGTRLSAHSYKCCLRQDARLLIGVLETIAPYNHFAVGQDCAGLRFRIWRRWYIATFVIKVINLIGMCERDAVRHIHETYSWDIGIHEAYSGRRVTKRKMPPLHTIGTRLSK